MFEDLSDEDRNGLKWAKILGVITLVIFVAIVTQYIWGGKGYDKTTLCEIDKPRPIHRVFLVDTTGSLSQFQQRFIQDDVLGLINASPTGSRFTVYLVEHEAGGMSVPTFDMCKPNSRDETNPLYENPVLAQKKFKGQFQDPLLELLAYLGNATGQAGSPLVESISDLFKLSTFDESSQTKAVHLYSDLLQNSDTSSVYKSQPLPSSTSCDANNSVEEFFVNLLVRKGNEHLQNDGLIKGWLSFLEQCSNLVQFERVRT
jgi:hypothetical protein